MIEVPLLDMARNLKYFAIKKFFALFIICFSTQQLYAQDIQHLSVQRLNDSCIDVYIRNKHPEKKMPVLILCQGSGYDSNTKGFLGVAAKFDDQVAGLMIEKQGVKYGDTGDSLSTTYKENNTVYNRLYDYLRALQYLKKLPIGGTGKYMFLAAQKEVYWLECWRLITNRYFNFCIYWWLRFCMRRPTVLTCINWPLQGSLWCTFIAAVKYTYTTMQVMLSAKHYVSLGQLNVTSSFGVTENKIC